MIEMGEMIAWGSDSALMREAADALEMAAPAVQNEAFEALASQLLTKRAEILGRPLKWAEAIEITAIVTSMPDEEKQRLLDMDDAPAVQGEPVAWLEGEPSMRGATPSNLTALTRSTRIHLTKPSTSNPVWPLYTAPQPAEQQPDVAQLVEHQSPSSYPVSGNVCFRESTGEWVLEITASINGAEITARHTQPAETCPEDVVGLPALYESTPDITKLVDALVACDRTSSAAEVGLIVDAALAAHRKGGG